MSSSVDVAIIGAGIVGLAVAHQIRRRSRLRVLVFDKGAGVGEGSTGASSAVCRFRYSNDEMVVLARDGIAAYQAWPDFLRTPDPSAVFHRRGSLWLAPEGVDWSAREAARLQGFGIAAETLDDGDLADRFPALSPCAVPPDLVSGEPHPCAGGAVHLLETDAGYMDPMAAATDLLAAVRAGGSEVRFRSPVTAVESAGGRATGVRLASGERIAAGAVVNAAGPWCNPLFDDLGLSRWPLRPTRIQIAVVDCPDPLYGRLPICADLPGGIYFREELGSRRIVVGSLLEADEQEAVTDPDDFDRSADADFTAAKLHALAHRIPGLPLRGVQGYSGLYTINAADVHPIVGETELAGFHAANGCSGHGFKLAPAIGALLARAITGEGDAYDTAADPAFLAVDRAPIAVPVKSAMA
ncbi:MAG: FAD-binding oxidoreductase [Alphaproteobacteria bacterium]|nr:FAD-binding oxidoreductase [Alphaproteobacteria bacterium]